MPPPSSTDAFLDSLWPLSRFVGYRPPPPSPGANVSPSRYLDHILPAPLRERHRRRREGEVELQSGRSSRDDGREGDEVQDSEADIEATGGRKHPGDGAGADRDHDSKLDKLKHKLWDMFLTLIGSFFGTVFLALASRALYLSRHNAPIVIGSFGAEGVLLYAAHDSPLTQPRNVVFGNTISAVLGVCVAKLFSKLEGFMVGEVFGVNWAAAGVSLSLALVVMQLFEITHPPGGATALLAVTIPQVAKMGWWYVPDIMVSSLIMLVWALIINNLGGRRYPSEWVWKSKWIVV